LLLKRGGGTATTRIILKKIKGGASRDVNHPTILRGKRKGTKQIELKGERLGIKKNILTEGMEGSSCATTC